MVLTTQFGGSTKLIGGPTKTTVIIVKPSICLMQTPTKLDGVVLLITDPPPTSFNALAGKRRRKKEEKREKKWEKQRETQDM